MDRRPGRHSMGYYHIVGERRWTRGVTCCQHCIRFMGSSNGQQDIACPQDLDDISGQYGLFMIPYNRFNLKEIPGILR